MSSGRTLMRGKRWLLFLVKCLNQNHLQTGTVLPYYTFPTVLRTCKCLIQGVVYVFTVQMFLIQNQPDCSGASGKHNIHYLMENVNVIRMWSIQLSKCKEPQCEAPWLGQIQWNWACLMSYLITVIKYHCWESAHANSYAHAYVMWTLQCWLQTWIQQAASWAYIEIIIHINMVKLFMHAENNDCRVFLGNWAEYFDLFMYMLKYFFSKVYFQNTVSFNNKKKG